MGILDDYLFDGPTYRGLMGASWPQSPQKAQAAFDMPTSSYPWGGGNQPAQSVPVFGQPDQAALPQNATPTAGQVAPPQPAQAQQAPSSGGGLRSGIDGFVENLHTGPIGALVGGLAGLTGMSSNNATERALVAKGLDPLIAKAASRNPQLMQAVIPQLFGGKQGIVVNNRLVDPVTGNIIKDLSDTKAPETRTMNTPDGKVDMQFDFKRGSWVPVPAAAAPGSSSGQQFGQASTIPPPPKGVDPDKYRAEQAELTSKETADVRDKAKGAIEFLQRVQRFAPTIANADPALYGPMAGTEAFHNWVRAPGAAAFGALSGGNNPSGQKNMEDWSKLQAGYKDVATSMLKARMGSTNLSNVDVNTINQISGGTTSANPKTSLDILSNLSAEAIDRIKDGVKRGVITPEEAAPYLNFKMPTSGAQSSAPSYKVIGVR